MGFWMRLFLATVMFSVILPQGLRQGDPVLFPFYCCYGGPELHGEKDGLEGSCAWICGGKQGRHSDLSDKPSFH